MTDPKRWSEAGASSELERELVLAGQSARMPDSERRALWASISLVAAPPAAGSPGPAAAPSGLTAYLAKGLVFLAAVGGITLGAVRLWPNGEQATRPVAAVLAAPAPTPPGVQPSANAPVEFATAQPLASTSVTPAPLVQPSNSKPRLAAASQLREESEALLVARAALRAGDAARCLSLLEQARLRYARGALGQEREALTIQALAQSGDRAAAARRARAFLRAHPQSPYVADVRLVAAE